MSESRPTPPASEWEPSLRIMEVVGKHANERRVLMIGNSFTHYHRMPMMLSAIDYAHAQPSCLAPASISRGAATLAWHLEEGTAERYVRRGGWDAVVLQDHSMAGFTPSMGMDGSIARFAAIMNEVGLAPHEKLFLYLTWADQHEPARQAEITASYERCAKATGARIAPAGLAFQRAFAEKPDLRLHIPDRKHPNHEGAYLAACVIFATLTGKNPQRNPYRLIDEGSRVIDLERESAAFLQRVAWETVTSYVM